jgi:hypothetical protein
MDRKRTSATRRMLQQILTYQQLAAIIWGAIFSNKLIFFSAHPVSPPFRLHVSKHQANRAAPQLRKPQHYPSHPLPTTVSLIPPIGRLPPRDPSRSRPPTHAHARAEALRHHCPLPLPRRGRIGANSRTHHHRDEQSGPRPRTL